MSKIDTLARVLAERRVWRKLQKGVRDEILGRDNYKCLYCSSDKELHIAHIAEPFVPHLPPSQAGLKIVGAWRCEVCPNCESSTFYTRRRKSPKFRCKKCGEEFENAH